MTDYYGNAETSGPARLGDIVTCDTVARKLLFKVVSDAPQQVVADVPWVKQEVTAGRLAQGFPTSNGGLRARKQLRMNAMKFGKRLVDLLATPLGRVYYFGMSVCGDRQSNHAQARTRNAYSGFGAKLPSITWMRGSRQASGGRSSRGRSHIVGGMAGQTAGSDSESRRRREQEPIEVKSHNVP